MADRGSMLPLYLGLCSIGLVLALVFGQISGTYLFREQLQQVSDQLALHLAFSPTTNKTIQASALKKLLPIDAPNIWIDSSAIYADKTAAVKICGTWTAWLKLPFIQAEQTICASASAR